MATLAPITPREGLLALLGTAPFHAIPVITRPTSFADALAQYRKASSDAVAVMNAAHGYRAARESCIIDAIDHFSTAAADAADRLTAVPAPDLRALADKIDAIERDGDWLEHGHYVAMDARRLAGDA